jgi:hypothetical protein
MVAEETNKYASLSQRKSVITDLNWEDTCVKEVKEYTDVLVVCVCVCVCVRAHACVHSHVHAYVRERVHMGIVGLPALEYYLCGIIVSAPL